METEVKKGLKVMVTKESIKNSDADEQDKCLAIAFLKKNYTYRVSSVLPSGKVFLEKDESECFYPIELFINASTKLPLTKNS